MYCPWDPSESMLWSSSGYEEKAASEVKEWSIGYYSNLKYSSLKRSTKTRSS